MRTWAGFVAAVLLSATIAIPAQAAEPEATVTDVQVTGPVSQRFNLVVLGDGYTAAEQPKFFADVERHVSTLWSLYLSLFLLRFLGNRRSDY